MMEKSKYNINAVRITAFIMTILVITLFVCQFVFAEYPTSGSSDKPYDGPFGPIPYYPSNLDSNGGNNTYYLYYNGFFDKYSGYYTKSPYEVFIGITSNTQLFVFCTNNNFIVSTTLNQDTGTPYDWTFDSNNTSQTTIQGQTYYWGSISLSSSSNKAQNFTFDTIEDVKDAIENYIINSNNNQSSSLNYSLPPGNLAIITTNASYEEIKLNTTMPLQSSLFSGNPWPNKTQRIGTYNTLPTSLNASTLGSVIDWQRTGDANLFGQTHNAVYQPSVISKFTYIVISNPYYYPANNMDDNQYTNGAITITMDDVVNIEIRNLTASINPTTGEVENTENGTTWTGEIDDGTGDITWTDNDGGNTNPGGGGNLSDATITGFQSWLKGILTSIRDIFEPAHDAIQTLSGSVRNFANWLYALYIWLPSPVLNLLTSAISLAIVIGVIKVFI